jgi:hypothetical protein
MESASVTMPRWNAAHYIGERFENCYVLAAQSRDSDILEQSNFYAALAFVGGEHETVTTVRSSHWLVGWIEQILIREDDADAIALGNEVIRKLSEHPVLDELDYDRRLSERREEYRTDIEKNPELWDLPRILKTYGDVDNYLDMLRY